MLMMIYGHGRGVKQNFKLAQKAICVYGPDTPEFLRYFIRLGKGKPATMCEEVSSGLIQGNCAHVRSLQQDQQRERALNRLNAQFEPIQTFPFKWLRLRMQVFAESRSKYELDKSGTASTAQEIEEKNQQLDGFLAALKAFESGHYKRYTKSEFADLDQRLRRVWEKLDSLTTLGLTTITMDRVRIAQRDWLNLREAWIDFANMRYFAIPSHVVAAFLTKKRIQELETLLAETNESR